MTPDQFDALLSVLKDINSTLEFLGMILLCILFFKRMHDKDQL